MHTYNMGLHVPGISQVSKYVIHFGKTTQISVFKKKLVTGISVVSSPRYTICSAALTK